MTVVDWGEAQEIRETHRKMGARNETYQCSACREEWPCRAVNEAVETMRHMGADAVYGEALRLNGKSHG
jgi:hypothetical protein